MKDWQQRFLENVQRNLCTIDENVLEQRSQSTSCIFSLSIFSNCVCFDLWNSNSHSHSHIEEKWNESLSFYLFFCFLFIVMFLVIWNTHHTHKLKGLWNDLWNIETTMKLQEPANLFNDNKEYISSCRYYQHNTIRIINILLLLCVYYESFPPSLHFRFQFPWSGAVYSLSHCWKGELCWLKEERRDNSFSAARVCRKRLNSIFCIQHTLFTLYQLLDLCKRKKIKFSNRFFFYLFFPLLCSSVEVTTFNLGLIKKSLNKNPKNKEQAKWHSKLHWLQIRNFPTECTNQIKLHKKKNKMDQWKDTNTISVGSVSPKTHHLLQC
jgi:hypothetical protein